MTAPRAWNLELEIAREAALAAGVLTESHFGCGSGADHVSDKAPGHPVTDADRHADLLIHQLIGESFPEDGWLSEETADSPERLGRRRVWVVDPIDGTKEFIAGIPEYVISIALVEDGVPVLGVIHQPTRGLLYWGTPADGAWCGDERIAVRLSGAPKPRVLVSRTEFGKGLWTPYAERVAAEPCGSIAWKLTQVAAGAADGAATLRPRSEWDIAGAAAILAAAGGRVTDHAGNALRFNQPHPVTTGGILGGSDSFRAQFQAMLKS